MDRSRFIIACTLVILALSLAARIILNEESEPAEIGLTTAAEGRIAGSPASRGYPGTKTPPRHVRPGGQSVPDLTVRSGAMPDDAGKSGIQIPNARALRVEAHARAKLDELDRRLHLTSDQKRRIFPLLARSAPDYGPDLWIGGIPGHQFAQGPSEGSGAGDFSAAIMNELDARQQALYEELLVDDHLWWSEIIAQIEEDILKTNPGASPLPPALIDDSGAGENLFDLLGR
jgi:hypothetical protein